MPRIFRRYGLFLVLAFVGVRGASAQFALQGARPGLSVTTFASGLNFPLGMAELSDGSIVVGVSNGATFYSATSGRLLRLVDADQDGFAETQQTIVAAVPGASPTAVRIAGSLLFVTGQGQPIVVYRLGTDLSAPLAQVGQIDIAYPGVWQHKHSALAARVDGTGQIEVYLQVGSADNIAATTQTAALTSNLGLSATLVGDALHRLRFTDDGTTVAGVDATLIATGLRNASGLAFEPVSGDLYIVENGIDGLIVRNEAHSADEINVIPAADIGGVAEDFGFPDSYVAYRTGTVVGSRGLPPSVVFQPIPNPMTGAESEGPNDIVFAPPSFTSSLSSAYFVGFHGKFSSGGVANEENPLVAVQVGDATYSHLIGVDEAGVGHLDGLLSRGRDLFAADLASNGQLNSTGANQGAIYRIHFTGENITGVAGWRLLSSAALGVTVADLAAMNLVQGIPGSYPPPQAQPNLYTGYNGTAYSASPGTTETLSSGSGFWWYLFDVDADPGGASQSVALPSTLATANPAVTTDTDVLLYASGDGFNMLGNPFNTSLDLSGIAGWPNSGILTSTVAQVWSAAGSTYETSVTRPMISAWQGFFVEGALPGMLSIPASARTDGGVLQRSALPEMLLAFELREVDGDLADRAAVLVLGENREPGPDQGDATKLEPFSAEHLLLAFATEDGEAMRAVESRPLEAVTLLMAVASVGASSDLVLSWPRVENLPEGWTTTLLDLETGQRVDLVATPSYAFSVEPSAARAGLVEPSAAQAAVLPPRFELRVGPRVVSRDDASAVLLTLEAPQPNPGSRQTRIDFSLGEPARVRLRVLDVQGREVIVALDEDRPAGAGSVRLDASSLASGLYVVRLDADGRRLTRRFAVMR